MSRSKLQFKISLVILSLLFLPLSAGVSFAEEVSGKKKPYDENVIINGDNVEYSTDNKEVSAEGNVEVNYKGTKLSCNKMKINTDTKDVEAEGNVRMDDGEMVIEGEKIIYNFQDKTGVIINANFRSNPYFGRGERAKKASEDEFIIYHNYMTTCSLDNPHYRMKSRRLNFFPGDKIQAKDFKFYVGQVPLLYLPQFNRSLKDPLLHVQMMPGNSKDWGEYVLTAWRYNLTDNISGRIYLDWRGALGIAEGFGSNYTTEGYGRGDVKFYYTQERSKHFPEGDRAEFQRYFGRWRHKWTIDDRSDFTAEYYKIYDSMKAYYGSTYNILKDFFLREYEKDEQPLSYASWHRAFDYSNLDVIVEKRTNRWYNEIERLPDVKYSLPSVLLFNTPFYLDSNTQLVYMDHKYPTPPNDADYNVYRIDTSNKLSFPLKLFFFNFNPYVMSRQTYYNKDVNKEAIAPRTVFYSGTDLSTKFYRIFNIKTDFLGLDINDLRHIITPTVAYSYNHKPTISNNRLIQMDGVDSIGPSNSASLEISNKLQTKRNGQSVDLVDLRVNNSYTFKPIGDTKRGGRLSDFVFHLELIPYSWMRVTADTTYKHSGPTSDTNYNTFSSVNYDVGINLAEERSFSMGQRYLRKGSNELTYSLNWRFNPKWRFTLYHRREIGHDYTIQKGLREQEYSITRDLHCWSVSLSYNVYRPKGETLWILFKLKAFPEMEFDWNKEYNVPKPGSQSPDMLLQ